MNTVPTPNNPLNDQTLDEFMRSFKQARKGGADYDPAAEFARGELKHRKKTEWDEAYEAKLKERMGLGRNKVTDILSAQNRESLVKTVEEARPADLNVLEEETVIPPAVFREATEKDKTLMQEAISRYLARQNTAVESELKKMTGVQKVLPDYLALIKESLTDLGVYYTGFCGTLENYLRAVSYKKVNEGAKQFLQWFYGQVFRGITPPFAVKNPR